MVTILGGLIDIYLDKLNRGKHSEDMCDNILIKLEQDLFDLNVKVMNVCKSMENMRYI